MHLLTSNLRLSPLDRRATLDAMENLGVLVSNQHLFESAEFLPPVVGCRHILGQLRYGFFSLEAGSATHRSAVVDATLVPGDFLVDETL